MALPGLAANQFPTTKYAFPTAHATPRTMPGQATELAPGNEPPSLSNTIVKPCLPLANCCGYLPGERLQFRGCEILRRAQHVESVCLPDSNIWTIRPPAGRPNLWFTALAIRRKLLFGSEMAVASRSLTRGSEVPFGALRAGKSSRPDHLFLSTSSR